MIGVQGADALQNRVFDRKLEIGTKCREFGMRYYLLHHKAGKSISISMETPPTTVFDRAR